MYEEDINKFELYLDKVSLIVLDCLNDDKIMNIIDDINYWGGEKPSNNSINNDLDMLQHYTVHSNFIEVVDESYFKDLAYSEDLRKETTLRN